jgi:hypothetical protein
MSSNPNGTWQQHVIETDLLVAGGGMAGVCAAIAAARQGIKVVLVQDRSVLGGNASSEIRMHIVGADQHNGRKGWRESGIIEELRLEDAARNPERCYPLWDVILYEKVMAEPNITLLLDTDVIGVEAEHDGPAVDRPRRTERMYEFTGPRGRIKSAKAIRALSEDEFIIKAKVFADCTGDGRLGAEAGADYRIGRESKAHFGEDLAQDVDDIHTLGNSILITSRDLGRPVPFTPPAWARKFDPSKLTMGRSINRWEYGFWWIEWGGMIDTIKDNHTTIRHELYGIALGLWDYVKNSGNFDSATWALDWIGAIPGKRESRRFMGEHMLTQQDVQEARRFEDEVAYGGWPIDLHPPRGIDALDERPFIPHEVKEVYGIPLRCYYSRNIENLFFAGRDISASHVAFASTRVMGTCAVGGEAVGFAAAQCVKNNTTPAKIVRDKEQLAQLQQTMLRQDVTLLHTAPAAELAHLARITASSTAAGTSASNLIDGLTRDRLDPKTGEVVKSHGWRSGPLSPGQVEWIELSWEKPVAASELHLWFDSAFQREVMLTPSDWITKKQVRGPQPETVRDYRVLINGEVVAEVSGNYQRKRMHRLKRPMTASTLRIEITATNGAPEARVLEVRVH